MPVSEIGDPMLQQLFGASDPREAGVRPTVRLPRKGVPPIVLVIIVVAFGVMLFMVLNARRTSQAEPPIRPQGVGTPGVGLAEPPPLYIPPAVAPPQPVVVEQPKPAVQLIATPAPVVKAAPPQPAFVPAPVPQAVPISPPAPPTRSSAGAPLVIDTGSAAAGAAGPVAERQSEFGSATPLARMRASALANRSMTVAQGTLIPAVLETGFDSTRPGFARAIVSRDVRGFDGKNVLIPRGSRLTGEYRSVTGQGQNRAMINWTRLIRPDGMTIAMESPATDPVGRGGVAANVNTHFFSRLGDALLQTTMSLGQALGSRAVTGPVVVLPNATSGAVPGFQGNTSYVPTLTVPPGASISIYVAQDLDFGSVETTR